MLAVVAYVEDAVLLRCRCDVVAQCVVEVSGLLRLIHDVMSFTKLLKCRVAPL